MNMLIEMNLDEKTFAKIKELLENGIYEDEKQVISRAIDNLYERTKATKEIVEIPTEDGKLSFTEAKKEYTEQNELMKKAQFLFGILMKII